MNLHSSRGLIKNERREWLNMLAPEEIPIIFTHSPKNNLKYLDEKIDSCLIKNGVKILSQLEADCVSMR